MHRATRSDTAATGLRASASRCNASPNQIPRAPDTPWGRPRGIRGWSLRELANRSDVDAGALSRIERGMGCPTPDQARRILRAFDEAG
jgi:predicted transcriptional regulator